MGRKQKAAKEDGEEGGGGGGMQDIQSTWHGLKAAVFLARLSFWWDAAGFLNATPSSDRPFFLARLPAAHSKGISYIL